MKIRLLHLTSALLISLASTANVFAASGEIKITPPVSVSHAMSGTMSEAMSCHASCSRGHMQCLSSGLDYSLVGSPQEGMERMEQNLSTRRECASASYSCHASCR